MGLKEQLDADLKEAMRARDARRLTAIRMLRAAIRNEEIARTDAKHRDHGKPLAEGDLLVVLQRQLAQRREALQFARRADRADLVAKEQAELDALDPYVPQQLTREQMADEVRSIIAGEGRDFRKVMPLAAQRLRGRADGRLVNEVVRELTGG